MSTGIETLIGLAIFLIAFFIVMGRIVGEFKA